MVPVSDTRNWRMWLGFLPVYALLWVLGWALGIIDSPWLVLLAFLLSFGYGVGWVLTHHD